MLAARTADEKQAEDIIILDLIELMAITDYFLIATGRTERHAQTISEEVHHVLKRAGRLPQKSAGQAVGEWILLDYGDFVVHIFKEERRDFYQLERLWRDAPRLSGL